VYSHFTQPWHRAGPVYSLVLWELLIGTERGRLANQTACMTSCFANLITSFLLPYVLGFLRNFLSVVEPLKQKKCRPQQSFLRSYASLLLLEPSKDNITQSHTTRAKYTHRLRSRRYGWFFWFTSWTTFVLAILYITNMCADSALITV